MIYASHPVAPHGIGASTWSAGLPASRNDDETGEWAPRWPSWEFPEHQHPAAHETYLDLPVDLCPFPLRSP
jgi:hypothetical protein